MGISFPSAALENLHDAAASRRMTVVVFPVARLSLADGKALVKRWKPPLPRNCYGDARTLDLALRYTHARERGGKRSFHRCEATLLAQLPLFLWRGAPPLASWPYSMQPSAARHPASRTLTTMLLYFPLSSATKPR